MKTAQTAFKTTVKKYQEEAKMELETLRSDMIAAMKAKDKARKEAISSLISAAKKVAIDEGCRDDIKPELVDLSLIHI